MASAPRQISVIIALVVLVGCTRGPATPSDAAGVPPAAQPVAALTTAQKPAITPLPAASTAAPTAGVGALTQPTAAPIAASATAPVAQPTARPTSTPAVAAPVSGEIVVFAASSLTDVFQDMATAFQQANPDARLTFNFGASSQLATQLGQGARADVFASADQTQMDNAKKSDSIGGQDRVFARNRLVLITPKDNPKQITAVRDLASDGVKFVTAQPSVPIGQYTAQMLDRAGADPSYGADFKSRVESNTVSMEDNVRQVVSKVQLGEVDAAVVYSTDATPQVRNQLQIIQVPDPLQTLASYPIAVGKGSNSAGGEAFVAYVLGPDGQATLNKWGFLLLAPTGAAAGAQPTSAPSGGQAPVAVAPTAPVPAVASATFSPDVAIKGLVGAPRSFTRDDLLKLPAETVQVSFQAGQATTSANFTGTRLVNVFDAAGGAKLPTDTNNAKLRITVMVTGADGYQVALGWGELDPEFGAAPILLAYSSDGQPMGDKQGMARLVVPRDKRGGRYVSTVKSIELRDPGPAQP
ncbi:MAG: molybdate ABC transporter substrate-binding protein [Chloroflexota bacterium]